MLDKGFRPIKQRTCKEEAAWEAEDYSAIFALKVKGKTELCVAKRLAEIIGLKKRFFLRKVEDEFLLCFSSPKNEATIRTMYALQVMRSAARVSWEKYLLPKDESYSRMNKNYIHKMRKVLKNFPATKKEFREMLNKDNSTYSDIWASTSTDYIIHFLYIKGLG